MGPIFDHSDKSTVQNQGSANRDYLDIDTRDEKYFGYSPKSDPLEDRRNQSNHNSGILKFNTTHNLTTEDPSKKDKQFEFRKFGVSPKNRSGSGSGHSNGSSYLHNPNSSTHYNHKTDDLKRTKTQSLGDDLKKLK